MITSKPCQHSVSFQDSPRFYTPPDSQKPTAGTNVELYQNYDESVERIKQKPTRAIFQRPQQMADPGSPVQTLQITRKKKKTTNKNSSPKRKKGKLSVSLLKGQFEMIQESMYEKPIKSCSPFRKRNMQNYSYIFEVGSTHKRQHINNHKNDDNDTLICRLRKHIV